MLLLLLIESFGSQFILLGFGAVRDFLDRLFPFFILFIAGGLLHIFVGLVHAGDLLILQKLVDRRVIIRIFIRLVVFFVYLIKAVLVAIRNNFFIILLIVHGGFHGLLWHILQIIRAVVITKTSTLITLHIAGNLILHILGRLLIIVVV